jgi:hypothetical protein
MQRVQLGARQLADGIWKKIKACMVGSTLSSLPSIPISLSRPSPFLSLPFRLTVAAHKQERRRPDCRSKAQHTDVESEAVGTSPQGSIRGARRGPSCAGRPTPIAATATTSSQYPSSSRVGHNASSLIQCWRKVSTLSK